MRLARPLPLHERAARGVPEARRRGPSALHHARLRRQRPRAGEAGALPPLRSSRLCAAGARARSHAGAARPHRGHGRALSGRDTRAAAARAPTRSPGSRPAASSPSRWRAAWCAVARSSNSSGCSTARSMSAICSRRNSLRSSSGVVPTSPAGCAPPRRREASPICGASPAWHSMGHGFAWGDVRASVCRTRICYRRISCTCATAAGALSPPTRRDFYPGTVTLFRVREPHPLSCDPLRLWRAAAAKVEVCHVPGTSRSRMSRCSASRWGAGSDHGAAGVSFGLPDALLRGRR
jgi:hypothetical protein